MKLKLHNFLCYMDKSFEFGNDGITLISGPSGCGKTSILRAIFFVLFGEGNKVQHYGKTSCSVELEFEDLKIVRTKRPNRLVVNEVYEDDTAQEIINKKFGQTFKTSGYIQQNNINSFILMNPSDKLAFLENFAFTNVSLNDIKSKCSKYASKLHDEHLITLSNLNTHQEIIKEYTIPEEVLFPIKSKNKELTYKNEKTRLHNILLKIKKTKKQKHVIETKIEHLNLLLIQTQTKREVINNNLLRINVLQDKYKQDILCKDSFEKLQSKLDLLLFHKDLKEKYKQYKIDCTTLEVCKMDEKAVYEREIKLLTYNLWSEYTQSEVKETIDANQEYIFDSKIIDSLESEQKQLEFCGIDDDKSKLDELNKNLSIKEKMYNQLQLQQNVYNCPSCKTSLKLEDTNLVIFKNKIDITLNQESLSILRNEIKNLSTEIEILHHTIVEKELNRNKFFELKQRLDDVRSKYEDFPEIDSIKEDINFLRDYEREQIEQVKQIEKLQYKLLNNIFSNTCNNLERKVQEQKDNNDFSVLEANSFIEEENEENLRSKIQEQKNISQENQSISSEIKFLSDKNYELEDQIKILNNQYTDNFEKIENIEELKSKLQCICTEILALGELENKHSSNIEKIEEWYKYNEEVQKYEQKKNKIKELEKEEIELRNKYASVINLKSKILEAESIAMTNIVETINNHARCYLDIFFDVNPISVQLQTFKETKKDSKPCINIFIEYKGMECDLTMLSGGEISRVILSFTLALSEIFNTPLMLLDECTASLDEDLTDTVFEGIRENFNGKLVLIIAHQVVSGKFDRVIALS